MLSLEEARDRILAATAQLPATELPLTEAVGRPVLEVVRSPIDLPPFDNSSMDGYAVRATDLAAASVTGPVSLRVAGTSPAGVGAHASLEPGTCVRIFTGSMLPPGADAVVMQEDVKVDLAHPGFAVFTEFPSPWENIRFRGEDVKQNTPLTRVPDRLSAPQAGLLAAAGVASVRVQRCPKIGLLATGDELREAGQTLAPGQIYESNRVALSALARRVYAVPRLYPLVPDNLAATAAALKLAFAECDTVVTTGGVSVGELDFVKEAFAALGGQVDFWQVAIKPGKPFAFGQWNGQLLFGLPGNPVSAFVTFYLLVCPALQKMQGWQKPVFPQTSGALAEPLVNDASRRHFMRVCVNKNGEVRLSGPQASHRLLSLARANGLVDVPPNTTLPGGASVTVLQW